MHSILDALGGSFHSEIVILDTEFTRVRIIYGLSLKKRMCKIFNYRKTEANFGALQGVILFKKHGAVQCDVSCDYVFTQNQLCET